MSVDVFISTQLSVVTKAHWSSPPSSRKKLTPSLSQLLYILEFELPFRVITSSFINSNNFYFGIVLFKPQCVKSLLKTKTKDNGIQRYFEHKIQVTCPFFFQVDFLILQHEICSQLLSVACKNPFQLDVLNLCMCKTTRKPFEGSLLNSY